MHPSEIPPPDLPPPPNSAAWAAYVLAFENWAHSSAASHGLGRETSIDTYRVMWMSLAKWALAKPQIALPQQLTKHDLEQFLERRDSRRDAGDDLSPRYVWRLLNLVDRILSHQSAAQRLSSPSATRPPEPMAIGSAAMELLQARPEWLHANTADKDPAPDYLNAAQAKDLVNFLSAARPRPGRRGAAHTWQELRNRSMVALQLGAGATPAEIRALTLASILSQGGPRKGLPWKLVIAGHTKTAQREAPIAAWAGHILRHWLETRQEQGIPGEHLFPSTRTGKPIAKVAHYLAVCQTIGASGLDKTLVAGGSYRLRHTFALRQLRRGREEAEVARWLGVEPAEMARYRPLVFTPVVEVV